MAVFGNLFGSSSYDDDLPEQGIKWPPDDIRKTYKKFSEWAAWYSGDPIRLSDIYSDIADTGDIQGRIWSDDIEEEVRTMLHVPLAGDIASVSANLLFGSQPDVKIPEAHQEETNTDAENAQDRLNQILRDAKVYSKEVTAAETASALGGCYLKINWDSDFRQHPFLSVSQQDNAIPEFYYGYLRRVLFHQIIEKPDTATSSTKDKHAGTYLRHLELHQPGQIQHALYEGSYNNLGDRIPLDEHWKTEPYADNPVINFDIDDILVRYVPNKKPNRLWRDSSLGQSDYQGIEGLMDAIDATYTSWIRDLKLAKARLLVPRHLLEKENGKLKFDVDKSVYTTLEADPTGEEGITPQQFDIRSKKHAQTAQELFTQAVSTAGYAPQTFGLEIEGRADSGTAIKLRERKSMQTKNKKEHYMTKPLSEALQLMLMVDQMMDYADNSFNAQEFKPRIEIGSSFKPTLNELADSLDKLNRAEAASYEVKVRLAHPDWSEQEIEQEVEKIKDEKGMNVQNPELRA